MNRGFAALFTAIVLLASGISLAAHHSFAMFDRTHTVVLAGVVREFQWTNPHSWIQLTVTDADGKVAEWSLEGGSPNSLSRQGWRSTTFKAGDVVTVRLRPMKDGTAAGQFIGAKFAADGHTVGSWE